MSLYSVSTGFLSIKPKISVRDGVLRVRTSALLRVLSLWRCTGCGRPSPPKLRRCQYCGKPVEADGR